MPRRLKPKPEYAISMRQLANALRECGSSDISSRQGHYFGRARCARFKHFGGLTRLDGFVVDQANSDVILWGLVEPEAPHLELDDFLVALRAAEGRYGIKRGNTIWVTPPAISIDPNPATDRRLAAIDLNSPDAPRQHEVICRAPQTVRVEGMPRHTRVAKTLVDADYRMKMVGQGRVTLPIQSPFPSDTDTYRQQMVYNIVNDQASRNRGRLTRYWFTAGQFDYQISRNSDTVFLETAQVLLRDEDQSDRKGRRVASGDVDPFARAFTCAWSERMEEIYAAEPIWRDMHNIYRHFAVSKILAEHKVLHRLRLDTATLLDRHVLEYVRLPDTLPGLGEFVVLKDQGLTLNTWVCGGVSLELDRRMRAKDTPTPRTREAASTVLARRPDPKAIGWAVAA